MCHACMHAFMRACCGSVNISSEYKCILFISLLLYIELIFWGIVRTLQECLIIIIITFENDDRMVFCLGLSCYRTGHSG